MPNWLMAYLLRIPAICQIVQGLLMHFGFAHPLYDLELSEEKKEKS